MGPSSSASARPRRSPKRRKTVPLPTPASAASASMANRCGPVRSSTRCAAASSRSRLSAASFAFGDGCAEGRHFVHSGQPVPLQRRRRSSQDLDAEPGSARRLDADEPTLACEFVPTALVIAAGVDVAPAFETVLGTSSRPPHAFTARAPVARTRYSTRRRRSSSWSRVSGTTAAPSIPMRCCSPKTCSAMSTGRCSCRAPAVRLLEPLRLVRVALADGVITRPVRLRSGGAEPVLPEPSPAARRGRRGRARRRALRRCCCTRSREVADPVSLGVVYLLGVLLVSIVWGAALGHRHERRQRARVQLLPHPADRAASRSPTARTSSRSSSSSSPRRSPRASRRPRGAARRRPSGAAREADLAAELARVLLGAPDLSGGARARRAADRAGVRARVVPARARRRSAATSARRRSRSTRGGERLGTLLVPHAARGRGRGRAPGAGGAARRRRSSATRSRARSSRRARCGARTRSRPRCCARSRTTCARRSPRSSPSAEALASPALDGRRARGARRGRDAPRARGWRG